METSFRSGLVFGVGFTLVFGIGSSILLFTTVYLGEYLMTKEVAEAASQLWGHDEPTVMRAEPTVRANRLFVLVTLKNETDNNQIFDAEVLLYGNKGHYYDTCPAPRTYIIEADEEISFRADCPSYGIDETATLETLGEVIVKFFRRTESDT